MSHKRGTYSTKQQEAVFSYMRKMKGESVTVDEIYDALVCEGNKVGKTTVYRALDRLAAKGSIVQVPDLCGGPVRYCYMATSEVDSCMVCLGCYKVYPLLCDGLKHFVEHVETDHGFKLEPQRTILFGWCDKCREIKDV